MVMRAIDRYISFSLLRTHCLMFVITLGMPEEKESSSSIEVDDDNTNKVLVSRKELDAISLSQTLIAAGNHILYT